MPQNPFLAFQQYETKPTRNTVDLSFRSNGSFGFGTLYPTFCVEVNPGESFSIETAFGLKFMPMPFPVQTPMRATMHFYYVRNRTIWKDFTDFIYGNKSPDDVPHPYIARPASDIDFWKTGGIADYLGVPTEVFMDNVGSQVSLPLIGLSNTDGSLMSSESYIGNINCNVQTVNYSAYGVYQQWFHAMGINLEPLIPSGSFNPEINELSTLRRVLDRDAKIIDSQSANKYFGFMIGPLSNPLQLTDGEDYSFQLHGCINQSAATDERFVLMAFRKDKAQPLEQAVLMPVIATDARYSYADGDNHIDINLPAGGDCRTLLEEVNDFLSSGMGDPEVYFFLGVNPATLKSFIIADPEFPLRPANAQPGHSASVVVVGGESTDIGHYPAGNPFAGSSPALPISSLPFRCYEAVYNAYYRNERLEPLLIDGVAEYNKYCPNMDSGADTFPYKLYKRNWEADFLTTCLPTPQQGIAPVVGVTGLSNVQIQDPDSNDIFTFEATVSGDGETITGGSFHNPDAPLAVRRTAQDIVTAGFTINDFRNVNALQRWVENNLRRGLKYRDQVLANTGVAPRFDELDMPEFIGGFSRPVQVSSITQTAPGGDAGVGDYAGQASCFGQGNHKITHYCDEAGFIIGILCVTPTPVYSQLLPKHFIKRTPLDYHHPVFNHIGMQPVTYDQVCPLQVYQSNPAQESNSGITFNDVFGYQRPYYDLLARTDEVHGLLRSTLRNYVMNRTFAAVPQLGADFIHVDPEQLNDVFTITEDSDVIVGEILFRVFAKRPVSLFGQPKIQ